MPDQEPVSKLPDNPDKCENSLREYSGIDDIAEFLKRHSLARRVFSYISTTLFYTFFLSSPIGRDALRDPNFRRCLFNRSERIGMLEDSVFNHELYFPNEDNTSLDYKSAFVGRWIGFDFYRKEEFGVKAKQQAEGRLVAFILNEVRDRNPDDYTPTGLFNFYNLDHLLHFSTPTIEDLVKHEFIRETTYERAFTRVGIFDRYQTDLALAEVTHNPLYTVTPKGNGLIGLSQDGGKKIQKYQGLDVLKPIWNS